MNRGKFITLCLLSLFACGAKAGELDITIKHSLDLDEKCNDIRKLEAEIGVLSQMQSSTIALQTSAVEQNNRSEVIRLNALALDFLSQIRRRKIVLHFKKHEVFNQKGDMDLELEIAKYIVIGKEGEGTVKYLNINGNLPIKTEVMFQTNALPALLAWNNGQSKANKFRSEPIMFRQQYGRRPLEYEVSARVGIICSISESNAGLFSLTIRYEKTGIQGYNTNVTHVVYADKKENSLKTTNLEEAIAIDVVLKRFLTVALDPAQVYLVSDATVSEFERAGPLGSGVLVGGTTSQRIALGRSVNLSDPFSDPRGLSDVLRQLEGNGLRDPSSSYTSVVKPDRRPLKFALKNAYDALAIRGSAPSSGEVLALFGTDRPQRYVLAGDGTLMFEYRKNSDVLSFVFDKDVKGVFLKSIFLNKIKIN